MKKFYLIFIVALFFIVSAENSFAQLLKVGKFVLPEEYTYDCDGVQNYLHGMANVHIVYKKDSNGDEQFTLVQTIGELTADETGEVFRYSKIDYYDNYNFEGVSQRSSHMNIKGNMGTHIIIFRTLEYNIYTNSITVVDEKIRCL